MRAVKPGDITEKHFPTWESLLKTDRPGCVTMQALGNELLPSSSPQLILQCHLKMLLVRDAVARLPNGEGSRMQVMELVRQSQYVEQKIHEKTFAKAVKVCLWDLNCEEEEEFSVKWDAKRCRWIYQKPLQVNEDTEP